MIMITMIGYTVPILFTVLHTYEYVDRKLRNFDS